MNDKLLRIKKVRKIVALSRTVVYRQMADGKFPLPVKATSVAVRWRKSDIMDWIESLPVSGGGPAERGTTGGDDQQAQQGRSGAADMDDKLLRMKKVRKIVALGRSSVYRQMADGEFPLPVKATSVAVRWRKSDIMDWMESLPVSGGGPAECGTTGGDDQQAQQGRSGAADIEGLRRLSTGSPKKRRRRPAARAARRTAARRKPHADADLTP